jgi:hypothetical protein
LPTGKDGPVLAKPDGVVGVLDAVAVVGTTLLLVVVDVAVVGGDVGVVEPLVGAELVDVELVGHGVGVPVRVCDG